MKAYIFITSDPQNTWKITKTATKIEGIKMADAVTGQFDIVAYAEFPNMNKLSDILEEIRSLKGVRQTQTAVSIPPRLE